MAGIYMHIPFCRKACHYCNFHFSTSLKTKDEVLLALAQEIQLQQPYLNGETVHTVYFGGGTPSILPVQQIQALLHNLQTHYPVAQEAEITLEANPDDITPEALAAWKAAGINRLSIGIQSFHPTDLLWMNRAHTAEQSLQAIAWAQAAGFHNLTIDLIYGTPGLTNENWLNNLQTAARLGIPHLSCYALTVEPGTALDKMIALHKKEPVDAALAAQHFDILVETAEALGYEQYEISNFAQPGFYSRHNTAYWQGIPYLGLGPSAHSYNGFSRQWNTANNIRYIQALQKGDLPCETEILTPQQQQNEYVMTALRTRAGLNLETVRERFGETAVAYIEKQAAKYLQRGQMTLAGPVLQLTRSGLFFADGIAADLFRL